MIGGFKKKMKKPTKLALKLARRIEDELGIEVEPHIHRVYAGYIQRGEGAWSWFMYVRGGVIIVGSQDTATKVLNAKKLWMMKGYNEIVAED